MFASGSMVLQVFPDGSMDDCLIDAFAYLLQEKLLSQKLSLFGSWGGGVLGSKRSHLKSAKNDPSIRATIVSIMQVRVLELLTSPQVYLSFGGAHSRTMHAERD